MDRPAQLPASLCNILENLPAVAIAYSGGLDSRFLCHAAMMCGCDVLAVHVRGPHIPQCEDACAIAWAQKTGLPLKLLDWDPLEYAEIQKNGTDRCYHCKTKMLAQVAIPGRVLCDGTNRDDRQRYRPGLRALMEAGVLSPLDMAGLGKTDIRRLASKTALENPEQKARPCLLTRFAYDTAPSRDALKTLELAEGELGALLGTEFDFRIRLTPKPVLQIEELPKHQASGIHAVMEKYFHKAYSIKVDAAISGFFDRK